jgi:hypothetical protein
MRNGRAAWLSVWALGVAAAVVAAEPGSNPYESIATRNPFGLKDPPPPPPPPTNQPPPAPAPTVKLKGITSILGSKRAVIEVTQAGAKGSPQSGPQSNIMLEGERVDEVTVVSIDVKNNLVLVKIGETETNLTFEKPDAKTAQAAPAPGPMPAFRPPGFPAMPGVVTPGMVKPPGAAATTPGGSSVFVMGSGGSPAPSASGASVVTFGAATPAGTPSAASGLPTTSPASSAAAAAARFGSPAAYGTPSASVGTDTGLRTIPTRQIRTDTVTPTTPAATGKTMTREEVDLLIEMNREKNRGKNFPPLPPTSLSPFIDHPDTKSFPPSFQPPTPNPEPPVPQ